MIVSRQHKFIFVAIPKTGSHAVRQALRAHMGPDDLEQVGLFVEKRFPIPQLAAVGHGHLSLEQLRPFLTADEFDGFFKFAFVRNPFDRFISYCSFMTRSTGLFEDEPKRVMRRYVEKPPLEHVLFQPQYTFLTSAAGELLTNYVGRVEQMQESYDEIARRIDVPTAALERVNASKRRDYRDYYDAALIEGVAKIYARDLELFGYEF